MLKIQWNYIEKSFKGNDAQEGLADTGGIWDGNISSVLWKDIQSKWKILVINSMPAVAH